ncbi:phosphatidylinositol-4,5-bisphosphate 3-kinase catalytic subunit beta isoform, putative [Entamoeba invadens IP1]|uniref:phosphatidylinositol-4,5-bisphosphate 3-kinase catalytic subunit beta isoform, putative n=1 Tax=Entamoeba invadens IP1 TaxID=370355 RepID=UPI0002C3D7AE|nr:phosphatidylinositol-4,5-bisphosphate 3-kinase catalytic subunit beta isoform, putative [Entamoeba invadens IP1]ELP85169.1 phosphatidylinositol-4,5-bisphosphate 3-kinase catalytic subunit beta isoform, putative [Entamoeba invadens IP1]|eukprot:XP_004184515.1 phosphatidylinositol-4,5-bisphosphate 3-kinase catalytic subunit beta isoform, putative [Entamoeba invadens IP1]
MNQRNLKNSEMSERVGYRQAALSYSARRPPPPPPPTYPTRRVQTILSSSQPSTTKDKEGDELPMDLTKTVKRPLPKPPLSTLNQTSYKFKTLKIQKNNVTTEEEVLTRAKDLNLSKDIPCQLQHMMNVKKVTKSTTSVKESEPKEDKPKRKKPMKMVSHTMKPSKSSHFGEEKHTTLLLTEREKAVFTLMPNGFPSGKTGISAGVGSVFEKKYLTINSATKPLLATKDLMNVEDTVEIRNFLKEAEVAVQQMKDDVLPYNYIHAEVINGALQNPVQITVNSSYLQYKTTFKCQTDITCFNVKKMIEKGVTAKASRMQVNLDKYTLTIAGTRQYFKDGDQLRQYCYVNDLSRREKVLNLELIENAKLNETLPKFQMKHQNLLSTLTRKCKASKFCEEVLSFTVYELLNFNPEIIYRKFYSADEITNCVKTFNENGNNFEKHKIKLRVSCVFYMGTDILFGKEYSTSETSETAFDARVMTDFTYSMLPLEVRLGVTLYASRHNKQVVVGFANLPLFDFQNFLVSGYVNLRMWPDEESDAVSSPLQNPSPYAPMLTLKFPDPEIRIVYDDYQAKYAKVPKNLRPISAEVEQLAVHNDPFQPLTDTQRNEIWQNRYNILIQFPDSLDLLLRAVPWNEFRAREEMADLIKIWPGIGPIQVIGLLDVRNSFKPAREYAVRLLHNANDKVILGYLPQFIQVLKFESYTCSALALFLLKRALKSRGDIGQLFYWLIVGENEKTKISLRSKLLLEIYNTMCGSQLPELKTQENFIKNLEETAINAKKWTEEETKMNLPKNLGVVNCAFQQNQLTLPFTSRETVSCVVVDKCKLFDSNAHPILLVFQSSAIFTQQLTRFIFKVGDNLMQDMLTLQMFKLMDGMWKKEGLDFRMTIYNVLATSTNSGIIQFVPNCETVNAIQTKGRGISGVFDSACIYEWLKAKNPNESELKEAIENFTYSCAGYCVATYVIGVGDRHNDNILIAKDGHLFHIDFGHFLGNVIKLGFYKKESAPFVLTVDFLYVITMGNVSMENYKVFEDICTKGFLILRTNAKTFIYSFMMMLCSGIPQLKHVEDVQYLKDAFMLDKSDEEAEVDFRALITQSLGTFRTRLNFFMHSMVH